MVQLARRARFALVILLGALALPGVAVATTTVGVASDVVTVTGDDGPSRIAAVSDSTRQYAMELQDTGGAAVVAGAGCVQVSGTSVDCGNYAPTTRIVVSLGGGDDLLKWITDPPMTVDAGAGNDDVETGYGNDTLRGGPGNDKLAAGRGDDTLNGDEGDDTVDGWDGSDTVEGGPGRDILLGDGATIYAGGNDTILARDGEGDSVDCGDGADRAVLDAADVVAGGCEGQERPAVDPAPAPVPVGPVLPPVPPALSVVGSVVGMPRIGRLAQGAPITMRLTATASCDVRMTLRLSATEAKRLGLGRRAITIATSATTTLPAGRARRVTAALAQRYRARLRKAKKISGALRLSCTVGSGTPYVAEATVRLRR